MTYRLNEDFYLVVSKAGRGRSLSARIASRKPNTKPGEVAMLLTVSLPSALFEKPQLRATIAIETDQIPPANISANVVVDIADLVKQRTGLDLSITVQAPE